MKKRTKVILILSSFLILSCGIVAVIFCFPSNPKKEEDKYPVAQDPITSPTLDDIIDDKLSQMTLEEKVGQLFMISISETQMTDSLKNRLETLKPGGIIIFKNNVLNYAQTSTLISDLQNTVSIPLFIGIDQEGGIVQRIVALDDANVLAIPPMMSVGNTENSDLAYQIGTVIGEEIGAFGINMDFAPVLDVYSNPANRVIGNRSFGTTSDRVIKMALPLSKGIKDSGVIPVYKHFPGHGDTAVDSHYGLPVINKTEEDLWKVDLLPFKEAISNGADVIMIAHIALPQIVGDKTPASISQVIVTDLLRNKMGYNGVVITDAVNMKALSDNYTTEEICVKALQAGVDIVLMPDDLKVAEQSIITALSNEEITLDQIDTAVKRILKLKYTYGLDQAKNYDKSVIGSDAHQAILDQVK